MKDSTTTNNKKLTLIYRGLFFIGLTYLVYCFFRYYAISNSMASELLPEYATGYVYSYKLALNGLIVSIGLLLAQLIDWINYKLGAAIILITTGIITVIVTLL